MGAKRDAKLFLWSGLFASIAILGLILITFRLHRFFFIAELIAVLFLGFVALSALAAVYHGLNFGFSLLSFMFGIMLLNLLLIYFKINPIGLTYLLTIVSSAVGFVMSVVNIGGKEPEDLVEEFKEPEIIEEEPVKTEEMPKPAKKIEPVKKTFKPGKVLASKTGNYYHSPKCEWAKKIKTKNRLWLKSVEEAKKKGLKPHVCLK